MPNDAGSIGFTRILAFSGGSLDRAAVSRSDADWIAARRADSRARLLRLNGDKVRIVDHGLHYEQPVAEDAIFLGLDGDGRAIFAGEASTPLEDYKDLRSLAIEGQLPRPPSDKCRRGDSSCRGLARDVAEAKLDQRIPGKGHT